MKTACKKLFNFSKHHKATKRASGASSTNAHSSYVGASGKYPRSVNSEVSTGSNHSTNKPQPHFFYSRRRLSPLPPKSQNALPTTANTAPDNQVSILLLESRYIHFNFNNPQPRQPSRRCSFTRDLHTALLYAAHNAPPSIEASVHSGQVYPVIESPGQEDVQVPEDDFAWIGRHVFASMGSLVALFFKELSDSDVGSKRVVSILILHTTHCNMSESFEI
ncbi:hypothetical protein J1614_008749 [Plenodomus biglobosus]|nr:hypothetical protein J1614_008749 [Plenodomus biglobosus]